MHASQPQYFFGSQAESELLLFGQASALAITICHKNLPLWGCVSLPSKHARGSYNLRHSAKKSVWRLGNICTPIWHSTQEGYCLIVGRGRTSTTLLLGSESAEIKRICADLYKFYKQLLTKQERSYGCSTAATLLSPAHRLCFECQPANFLAPYSFPPLSWRY